MESVRKASGFLFYTFGALLILVIVLVKRGVLDGSSFLHVLDLPILLIVMLYGGSSLYLSLTRGKKSLPLFITVFVPLGVLFTLFCLFNFVMPLPSF